MDNLTDDLDPFDVSQLFVKLLKGSLSASNIHKVSLFAYRFRVHHLILFEDLITVMGESTLLSRLNLFYVVDALCKQSIKFQFTGYVELTRLYHKKLVECVVDCVRSKDGSLARKPHREGVANVGNVRKVLSYWRGKDIIAADQYAQLDGFLSSWMDKSIDSETISQQAKDAILRRMEEDRERQKKSREETWLRPILDTLDGAPPDIDPEFLQAWGKPHSVTEADISAMKTYRERIDTSVEERLPLSKPASPMSIKPISQSSNQSYLKDQSRSVYQSHTDSALSSQASIPSHVRPIPQQFYQGIQPTLRPGQPLPQRPPFQQHSQKLHPHTLYNQSHSPIRHTNALFYNGQGSSSHNPAHSYTNSGSISRRLSGSPPNIPNSMYPPSVIPPVHVPTFTSGGFRPKNGHFPQLSPQISVNNLHPHPHPHLLPLQSAHQSQQQRILLTQQKQHNLPSNSYSSSNLQHHQRFQTQQHPHSQPLQLPVQPPPPHHQQLYQNPTIIQGTSQRHSFPTQSSSGYNSSSYTNPRDDQRKFSQHTNRR
ncbi:hypothetical protein QVD99_008147 [Batrachochytrium dendrobatidis]|nr:hypothetical protein QVD99_008147 [Batrachochytrium dendrobatidis]